MSPARGSSDDRGRPAAPRVRSASDRDRPAAPRVRSASDRERERPAPPRVRRVGDRALLLEVDDNAQVHAVAERARAAGAGALQDVVAGDRTVLVVWPRPPVDERLLEALETPFGDAEARAASPSCLTIPVRYDGPDLGAVAELTGLSAEEVIRRHQTARYRVAFIGFSPGFGYLIGGDPALAVPRRESPRELVEPGSVAIAGPYTAVYPAASPGGWQLIGSTELRMFDPDRDPPALLEPGGEVVFEPCSR